MLRVLHTGDVHLDSAFSGLDSRHAEIRRGELRAAFSSMMTYARTNEVDLLLIAGDLFDGASITRETLALLIREFERFEKPVFITPGNHDPASPDSIWAKNRSRDLFPPNVHIFRTSELSSIDLDVRGIPVTVHGFGFTESSMETNPIENRTVADPSRVNLLVCHCDMLGSTGRSSTGKSYCPMTAAQLENFGADYAALGHIHNPPASGHDNRFAYCGCPEARAFDETGPKGACVIDLDKTAVKLRRVRFSRRRYEKAELALTGVSTQADVRDAVTDFIRENGYGEDTLLSLRLTGVAAQSLVIDTEALENTPFGIFYLRVEDATLPALDFAALETDITVTGEVYRQLKPSLESADPRTREVGIRALRYALSALAGEKTF